MDATIGRFVRLVKALSQADMLSREWADGSSTMGPMEGKGTYLAAFLERTRRLRGEKGWTQAQMALALGIPEERYRKYETRTPLPHDLLERFALITGKSIHYIVTGREQGVTTPEIRRPLRRAR